MMVASSKINISSMASMHRGPSFDPMCNKYIWYTYNLLYNSNPFDIAKTATQKL